MIYSGGKYIFYFNAHFVFIFKQAPNPTASEFIPKGGSNSRLGNMSQSNMSAFSQALFSHPSMGGPANAGLAPGEFKLILFTLEYDL